MKETDPQEKAISLLHPLSQAAAALYNCLRPVSQEADINKMADELADALCADRVGDIPDSAVLLAMQARVLDAVFNRFILQSLPPDRAPNVELLRVALLAQRQSAGAVDKLKRHQKKSQKTDDRTEGP